jgi:DNA-binding MarR family transcriptional regulator
MARPAFGAASRHHEDVIETYARRGSECAYANLKMLARVASNLYDDALRPVNLRAGQLALMWAILAAGPVEIGRLSQITITDQTTLSRTIDKLRKARLVHVRPGRDRRVKVITLSETGRQRFAAAMPFWEEAQKRANDLFSLAELRDLARAVRRQSRQSA